MSAFVGVAEVVGQPEHRLAADRAVLALSLPFLPSGVDVMKPFRPKFTRVTYSGTDDMIFRIFSPKNLAILAQTTASF
jgi:hypothetical protein